MGQRPSEILSHFTGLQGILASEAKRILDSSCPSLPQGRKGERKGNQQPRKWVEEKLGLQTVCPRELLPGEAQDSGLADGRGSMCGQSWGQMN